MPRDFSLPTKPLQLTESPGDDGEGSQGDSHNSQTQSGGELTIRAGSSDSRKSTDTINLHPVTRLLTISDIDSCVALEDLAFTNPDERCSREKASTLSYASPGRSPSVQM